jgi:hypothetical protein
MAAVGLADLEVGDTAGLETCATKFATVVWKILAVGDDSDE